MLYQTRVPICGYDLLSVIIDVCHIVPSVTLVYYTQIFHMEFMFLQKFKMSTEHNNRKKLQAHFFQYPPTIHVDFQH